MSESDEWQVVQLAEAIHRARNDLATIASMLQLQGRMSDNAAVKEALGAAQARVIAMSRVNSALDAATRVEPVIDVTAFLGGIVDDLQFAIQERSVTIQLAEGPELLLPVSYARPLGLVANEWVTNALKYAFLEGQPGAITVALSRSRQCQLTVSDDGIGMDPDAPPRGTGLGTRLVKGLARQLAGEVEVNVGAAGGTTWTLTFDSLPTP